MHVCTHTDDRMFVSRLVLVWCGVMGCVGMGRHRRARRMWRRRTRKDGATPLFIASQNGHDKVAELLVVRDEGRGRGKCPYI